MKFHVFSPLPRSASLLLSMLTVRKSQRLARPASNATRRLRPASSSSGRAAPTRKKVWAAIPATRLLQVIRRRLTITATRLR